MTIEAIREALAVCLSSEGMQKARAIIRLQDECNPTAISALLQRLDEAEAARDSYKARCQALTDDALARVMEASEDELDAALKLEGKDPNDTARLAGQAVELALLTAERDSLRQRLEEAEKALQWRPIETAPKDKTLLLWHPSYGRPVAGHSITGDLWAAFAPGVPMLFQKHLETPTHWLPLPPAPKG